MAHAAGYLQCFLDAFVRPLVRQALYNTFPGSSLGPSAGFTSQLRFLIPRNHHAQAFSHSQGKPTDNAYVESFNGTLRSECLDAHWFATLEEAKQIIEAWRREYNESRPHRALGERTPNEFASEFAASRELTGPPTAENSLSG